MRIVLFTETFLPKTDGIVTTVCQTIKQLKALGHDVLVFAPDGGASEYEGCRIVGMRGHAFPFYPELRLSPPRAFMRRIIAEFQPDIIHVTEPAFLGIAGLYYSGGGNGGALRLPLAISYHTDLPKYLHYYGLSFIEPWIWPLLRLRHNRASVNLATSAVMVRQLQEHGIARVALWPGGADSDRFQPARRSDASRSRLSAGHPESPLLLYVGRLSAEKDIEILKPILQSIPDARLALVGDGPHRKALEKHFAGQPVHFAGFLHGNQLAAAYASSDVFVMPSRTETLGLVVLEAMCSGLPVVAARAGGIPEMIEEGVSGFLFDDASQAIAAVRHILSSRERRRAIGHVARIHACDRSWKAATLTLLEHYRHACAIQAIATGPAATPKGLRPWMTKALKSSTLFAIRKLLP